jgi:hypothetical protein
VSPVRYELGFYIPEDNILPICSHSFLVSCKGFYILSVMNVTKACLVRSVPVKSCLLDITKAFQEVQKY